MINDIPIQSIRSNRLFEMREDWNTCHMDYEDRGNISNETAGFQLNFDIWADFTVIKPKYNIDSRSIGYE